MTTATYWIDALELLEHPEGGYYKEVYRSKDRVSKDGLPPRYGGDRSVLTSIYYLLDRTNKSHFHKVNSDETWHFYQGNSAIELLLITEDGLMKRVLLGANFTEGEEFQFTVPQNCWFAAHLINKNGYALVGCTVAPGFEFADFFLADKKQLSEQYPQFLSLIADFCI